MQTATTLYTHTVALLNDEMRDTIQWSSEAHVRFSPRILEKIGGDPLQLFIKRSELLGLVSKHDFGANIESDSKRDFGVFEWEGAQCAWKIDYYDLKFAERSPDPSDATVTQRILTILLLEEF